MEDLTIEDLSARLGLDLSQQRTLRGKINEYLALYNLSAEIKVGIIGSPKYAYELITQIFELSNSNEMIIIPILVILFREGVISERSPDYIKTLCKSFLK